MISLGRFDRSKRCSLFAFMASVAIAAAVALPGSAAGHKSNHRPAGSSHKHKSGQPVGTMYTETNGVPNKVLIFHRFANGKLSRAGSVSTGGKGGFQPQPGCTPPGGCPILDTQNEVVITSDRKLLFVVNAGSDTITSFRATGAGLRRVSVVSSHGKFPNSLTIHGHELYVLNSDSTSIAGFRFTPSGRLKAIAGSSRSLVGGAIPGLPRQIGFDNTGRKLMVTLLANTAGPPPAGGTANTIDIFRVSASGVAGAGTAHNSTGNFPFAFAFDKHNQAIVAQVNKLTPTPGTAQVYSASGSAIGVGVTTMQFAPCWVVATRDGRHAYIVNTGGGAPGGATVAQYRISSRGSLKLLGTTPALNEFLKNDEALSRDDRYLYVLSPVESGSGTLGPTSHIDEYRVRSDGRLALIGQTPSIGVPGLTGLAGS